MFSLRHSRGRGANLFPPYQGPPTGGQGVGDVVGCSGGTRDVADCCCDTACVSPETAPIPEREIGGGIRGANARDRPRSAISDWACGVYREKTVYS
jgi:hypothetical protein